MMIPSHTGLQYYKIIVSGTYTSHLVTYLHVTFVYIEALIFRRYHDAHHKMLIQQFVAMASLNPHFLN